MSQDSRLPLSDAQIDRVFSMLSVRYGDAFASRWRDLDIDVVKGDWARELGNYRQDMGPIRWAMEHLPERPPTIMEFKKLCFGAPSFTAMIPDDSPVRLPNAEEREYLRGLSRDIKRGGFFAKPGRDWARRLIARHDSGEYRSTAAALAMARDALRTEHWEQTE